MDRFSTRLAASVMADRHRDAAALHRPPAVGPAIPSVALRGGSPSWPRLR